jgi:hypothetical protein
MERTEEDKITQAGIKVTLGGKDYKVRPLCILDSKTWRKEVAALLGELPKYAKANTDNPDEFQAALNGIMIATPDKVIDLFFSYAKDLPREEIEKIATDKEIADAFSEVVKLAFPLVSGLGKAMGSLA